jgi:two-component system invasion response regulator UvrY
MAPIGVLLVDDSPFFLATTTRILAKDARVRIVGQALSGEAALEQLRQVDCDLVLLDIALPQMNGLEVAQRLRELPEPPRVVLLSLNDLPEYREAAANCADAFLGKSQAATQLLPLIRSLFAEDPAPAK